VAGIGTIVLGVVVAIGVASVFTAVIGGGVLRDAGMTDYRTPPIR
jgi:hypothetical protein